VLVATEKRPLHCQSAGFCCSSAEAEIELRNISYAKGALSFLQLMAKHHEYFIWNFCSGKYLFPTKDVTVLGELAFLCVCV
jgi:hypothetical protein